MPSPARKRMLLDLDNDASSGSGERKIKDSVHDYHPFGGTIMAIIDTPQFQRLRRIKQLGTSYCVWPAASHSRFEHCLGVAHLSQDMARQLKDRQPELGITQRDVQCVTIAGLCHDLGHGPWSHVWDSMFIPAVLPDKKWCHEDASMMMFDALLEENGLELDPDDSTFVKALIMGDITMCKKPEKPYLFQIVANKQNGLDVDKFDYIARDSQAIDQTGSMSLSRLIHSARVIGDQICYNIKDANQIYELYHTRFSLHKRIYNHKTAKAIEYMIVDALMKAEPVLHIARRLEDPRKYLYLTDSIQEQIEASEDPRLAEAQKILHRILVRDLYKHVDFKVFPWDFKAALKQHFNPKDIVAAAKKVTETPELRPEGCSMDAVNPQDVKDLSEEHVIVDLSAMHHGMKSENPLDFVKFYSKHNMDLGISANLEEISVTMPQKFGEVLLRIFTRDSRFHFLIQVGYRELLRTFTLPKSGTPSDTATADEFELDLPEVTLDDPAHPATAPSSPRPRARSRSRTMSRNASFFYDGAGKPCMTPGALRNNPFTTVGPAQPGSPTRAGGKARVLKRDIAGDREIDGAGASPPRKRGRPGA